MFKFKSLEENETQPQNNPNGNEIRQLIAEFAFQYQRQQILFKASEKSKIPQKRSHKTKVLQKYELQMKFHDIQELKHSLSQKMEKVYNSLAEETFEKIQDHQQFEELTSQEQVRTYIARVHSANLKNQMPRLMAIISQNPFLQNFLQWIFDAAPLLFYEQLILIACKIVLSDNSMANNQHLRNIIQISRDINFLNKILNDTSLKLFKKLSEAQSVSQIGINSTLYDFYSCFAQTILESMAKGLAMKSFNKKPKKQNAQELMQLKMKKSKKIKRVLNKE